jgi:hypothetical protein
MSRKEKKYHFIYKTIDTRNGNFYIGMHSTDNLNDGYVGSGTRLRKLIYKHGKEIFDMEILEFLPDRKSLKEREAEIVNSDLLLEEKCMNLRIGGEGGFTNREHEKKFIKSSEKTRWNHKDSPSHMKLSELRKNQEWCINYGKKVSLGLKMVNHNHNTFKNKKHSEETKMKISKSLTGRGCGEDNSQFGTCWVFNDEVKQSIKIKKDELQSYLDKGWFKGRKMKF